MFQDRIGFLPQYLLAGAAQKAMRHGLYSMSLYRGRGTDTFGGSSGRRLEEFKARDGSTVCRAGKAGELYEVHVENTSKKKVHPLCDDRAHAIK